MTRNEVRYEYSKKEYENAVETKNNIRNRAGNFFNIAVIIISATTSISFAFSNNHITTHKLIALIFAASFLVLSLVFFLLIYCPSSQMVYHPKDVIAELRRIEYLKENQELVDYYDQDEKFDFIVSELALSYAAERHAENFSEYQKKNKEFKFYFIIMSIFSILSIAFSIISIGV